MQSARRGVDAVDRAHDLCASITIHGRKVDSCALPPTRISDRAGPSMSSQASSAAKGPPSEPRNASHAATATLLSLVMAFRDTSSTTAALPLSLQWASGTNSAAASKAAISASQVVSSFTYVVWCVTLACIASIGTPRATGGSTGASLSLHNLANCSCFDEPRPPAE